MLRNTVSALGNGNDLKGFNEAAALMLRNTQQKFQVAGRRQMLQ